MEIDLLEQLTGDQPDSPPSVCTVSPNGDQIINIHIPKKIQDFFLNHFPNGRGAQNTTSWLFSTGKKSFLLDRTNQGFEARGLEK